MPKAHKKPRLNSTTKRNLFIFAVVLIALGLLAFFIEDKNKKEAEQREVESEIREELSKDPKEISPNNGCEEKGEYHVCNIKIINPSDEKLDWASIIYGIEGASLSEKNGGTVAPNGSSIVQVFIPRAFCSQNPDGEGEIKIFDATSLSNQSEADFLCSTSSE